MAGTIAYAAKARVIALLQAEVGLQGPETKISHSYSGKLHAAFREYLYAGKVSGPVQLAAMKGASRIRRQEQLSMPLHIMVSKPGEETTETAEARAVALGVYVEEAIALDPLLGSTVTGLLKATIDDLDLDSGVDDDGAFADLIYTIGFMSHIV